ncbi:MAG: DUF4349 domain-containing protein [Bacillota bacterium]
MINTKRLLGLFMALLLIATLAACAAKTENSAATPAPASRDSNGNTAAEAKAGSPGAGEAPIQSNRKIIMNASVVVRVQSIAEAVKQAEERAHQIGGHVKKSYLDERSGSVTLMIPAGSLDSFIESIDTMGKILNKEKSSEDVTDIYYDTEVRIKNLETQIVTMRALLQREGWKVSEILEIEREIRRLTDELEILKGQMTNLDRRIQFSQLNIRFIMENTSVDIVDNDTFAYKIRLAFNYGVEALMQAVTLAVSLIVFLLPLVPVAVAVYAAWRYVIKPLAIRFKKVKK